MLGAIVGEWVGTGRLRPGGAMSPDIPDLPGALVMGAVVVAATQRQAFPPTLRVWVHHHEAAHGLPGIGPWAIHGGHHVPDDEAGESRFRPWTVPYAWLAGDPEASAHAALSLVHDPDGIHHQGGVAVTRAVAAQFAGAGQRDALAMFDDHPALRRPGDALVDAMREGVVAGYASSFDGAMAAVGASRVGEPWRGVAGFVAGAVAEARWGLPGWCHVVGACSGNDDLRAAFGFFAHAARGACDAALASAAPPRPEAPLPTPARRRTGWSLPWIGRAASRDRVVAPFAATPQDAGKGWPS